MRIQSCPDYFSVSLLVLFRFVLGIVEVEVVARAIVPHGHLDDHLAEIGDQAAAALATAPLEIDTDPAPKTRKAKGVKKKIKIEIQNTHLNLRKMTPEMERKQKMKSGTQTTRQLKMETDRREKKIGRRKVNNLSFWHDRMAARLSALFPAHFRGTNVPKKYCAKINQ